MSESGVEIGAPVDWDVPVGSVQRAAAGSCGQQLQLQHRAHSRQQTAAHSRTSHTELRGGFLVLLQVVFLN
jgi:hypothetical protein